MADKYKLNRRQFLKWAVAGSVVAASSALGYVLVDNSGGEVPDSDSPYLAANDPVRSSSAPLLLLTNERTENPFGPYLAEILHAEGLNCFQTADLSALSSAFLGRFAAILLAEGSLDSGQRELLEAYVAGGGRLIAMRPDASLAALLGVERAGGATQQGYIRIEAGHPASQGMPGEALQFHGEADHYRLAGAETIAWLADGAGAQSAFPAVTVSRFGAGQAALWAFDLARSVALTRQGNPAWANQERDGRDGIRAHDAFVDWIDLDRIAAPQADLQMRLLVRLIGEMLASVLPLPRLWYFPGASETMLIATSDAHGNPAYAVEDVLTRVERYGGHMSVYYTPPDVGDLRRVVRKIRWWAADLPLIGDHLTNSTGFPSPSDVAGWRERGHEFGLHPYVEQGVEAGFQRYWKDFTRLGYGPVSRTVRTHRVLWSGWVESARVQASYGLRMNLDYYHTGPAFRNEAGEWVYGYFTGSGLPMRFVDEQGRILNIYQQATQLVDEHLFEVPWGTNVGLSADEAVQVSETLLARSLGGAYSALGAQFHVDPFAAGGTYASTAVGWLEGTLDYAARHGIPIWSASEWLRFVEIRDGTALGTLRWDPSARRLTFQLLSETEPAVQLTVMVPWRFGEATVSRVEVDGASIDYGEQRVDGQSYGWFSVGAGDHQVVVAFA